MSQYQLEYKIDQTFGYTKTYVPPPVQEYTKTYTTPQRYTTNYLERPVTQVRIVETKKRTTYYCFPFFCISCTCS